MNAVAHTAVEFAEAVERSRLVGHLVKQALGSIVRSIDAGMQPLGLTAMQWEPLVLIHFGRADTVAALARETEVACGAMTRMLDRLERKQLLRRRRSDTDRRVVHVELMPQGKKVIRAILPVVVGALDQHLHGFTRAEVSLLTRLLERMLANGARLTDQ